jgi:predicted RNase H-like nuclease (RuvC/YqgF family)
VDSSAPAALPASPRTSDLAGRSSLGRILPTTHSVSEPDLRIRASTERIGALRERLHGIAQRLDELGRSAATAAADRARVAQLEAELAGREELRHTLRERLSEVERMLGQ